MLGHKKQQQPIRQGDILLKRVDRIPGGLVAVPRDSHGRVVLAYGERSGHAHVIDRPDSVELLASDLRDLERRFLRVEKEVGLAHQAEGATGVEQADHETLTVPPGDYEVIQQREASAVGVAHWAHD